MYAINQEKKRIGELNWNFIYLILTLASIGFVMLYSAGGGSFEPWLTKQLTFFAIFFVLMIFIALKDIRFWFKFSYFAYAAALLMVIAVDIAGHNAMGATRWFRIGSFTVQPSEIMKVCTVFALARYFYDIDINEVNKPKYLIIPILLIVVPVFFVLVQPDLGTGLILAMTGAAMLFLAGVTIWAFVFVGVATLVTIPFAWFYLLYDYQRQRVLTFLDPSQDPLGSGYNIIQSKIAIGSGGLFGKGYLQGSQAQLDFLPEKQTDFVFTMLNEELGFIGGLFTIAVYCAIIAMGFKIAFKIKHQYGRMLVLGILCVFFIHMFVNMGMVMGILPVVGAPLPLISYGGTITAAMLIGFGLILNADLYFDADLDRDGGVL